jgi:hypothetical protein
MSNAGKADRALRAAGFDHLSRRELLDEIKIRASAIAKKHYREVARNDYLDAIQMVVPQEQVHAVSDAFVMPPTPKESFDPSTRLTESLRVAQPEEIPQELAELLEALGEPPKPNDPNQQERLLRRYESLREEFRRARELWVGCKCLTLFFERRTGTKYNYDPDAPIQRNIDSYVHYVPKFLTGPRELYTFESELLHAALRRSGPRKYIETMVPGFLAIHNKVKQDWESLHERVDHLISDPSVVWKDEYGNLNLGYGWLADLPYVHLCKDFNEYILIRPAKKGVFTGDVAALRKLLHRWEKEPQQGKKRGLVFQVHLLNRPLLAFKSRVRAIQYAGKIADVAESIRKYPRAAVVAIEVLPKGVLPYVARLRTSRDAKRIENLKKLNVPGVKVRWHFSDRSTRVYADSPSKLLAALQRAKFRVEQAR